MKSIYYNELFQKISTFFFFKSLLKKRLMWLKSFHSISTQKRKNHYAKNLAVYVAFSFEWF